MAKQPRQTAKMFTPLKEIRSPKNDELGEIDEEYVPAKAPLPKPPRKTTSRKLKDLLHRISMALDEMDEKADQFDRADLKSSIATLEELTFEALTEAARKE